MMTECKDVTIIGGGSAGLYAAFYCGMRDLSARIIEFKPKLGGKVHVYPEKMIWDVGGITPITGAQLMKQMEEQARTFDPEIILNEKVEKLEKNQEELFVVTTHTGHKYVSRTVILATGGGIFEPIKLDIEGADRFEVSNLHYTVQSLEAFKDKKIVISGGGDTAIDWANELEPIAEKVSLIYRGEQFKAMEAHIAHLEASSAGIYKNTKIEKLIADEDGRRIKEILTKNQKTGEEVRFEVDDLIINYGYDRELKFIKESPLQIELERDFFVKGSGKAETNIAGLYAAGDILSFDGKVRLIAGAYNDAANAVNQAKLYLKPDAYTEIYVSSHNAKFDEKNRELLSHLYTKN
ncbi:NAD(P)/FAD-dependent oxidoreductase [Lederbergia sp. NSJ-179]|uniref:NAD(P)/FAD-dependent oxidoreductase n=1 Tax=Lederbergia sp. NSJ-179 TaxID=2931402 RepID=UPI001FD1442F|nr:NAD(P)/FAD-dependent oxidoreductase [Lederbergia sp. NSJ-179]MCJ7841957.1 NAD(P)/FAD-dependent oxidoreductase [Lederbergia sp. NSJ-179]